METAKPTHRDKWTAQMKARTAFLTSLCGEADRLTGLAYQTYDRQDLGNAAKACLAASLQANRDGLDIIADEYGRKHAELNKKACGG